MGGGCIGVKNRLKEIRMREYLMNVSEFAKYLGVPITVYSGWETNSSRPKLEKAFEIAIKLNKKVDDIWFYE